MNDKEVLHVASDIHEALLKLRKSRYLERLQQLSLLASKLQEVVRDARKLGLALARDWFAAAEHCRRSASRQLDNLPYTISKAQTFLDRRERDIPTLSELLDELKAVEAQFGDVEMGDEEYSLSVVTEPIILEDVYLGPFRIALYLGRLHEMYARTAYYVVALEPHPAATDDSVTHPHVSNEVLCEGDGVVAIKTALEEGRLFDFFEMVCSILNTYNPDSPYVPLSDWYGTPCYECGYVMDDESSYHCSYCDNAVCDQCSHICTTCSEIICGSCVEKCEICEGSLCPTCAKSKCNECGSVCCGSCLNEYTCVECLKENDDEGQESEDKNDAGNQTEPAGAGSVSGGLGASPAGAAVQPDGLGQTAVLPGSIG